MANALRGEVAIPGTPHVLRYDINALCEAENISGENIPDLLARMADGTPPSFITMRCLLWAGLRWKDATLTLPEAGTILGDVGPQVVVKMMGEALNAALGMGEAPSEKNH